MGSYLKCPRRFQEEKINGRRTPSSVDAELGTFVHLTMELLMQKPAEERTFDAAMECCRLAWNETLEVEDFKALNLSADDMRDFRWRARYSIENYFNDIEDPTKVDVVATEQKMNAVLGGVPVRGIVDRVDRNLEGEIEIVDYKNGKVPDPKWPDQAVEKVDQMNIYAAMTRETTGLLPKRGRLIFTSHSVDMPVEYTDESIDETITKIKGVWEMVKTDFESGVWTPNPSGLCAWCPFMEECPEGMADATFRYLKGKVRQDAPGYAALAATAHLR